MGKIRLQILLELMPTLILFICCLFLFYLYYQQNKEIDDMYARLNSDIKTITELYNLTEYKPEIVYDNLTQKEEKRARSIMKNVSNIYLKFNRAIIFTSDTDKYCPDSAGCFLPDESKIVVGMRTHKSPEEILCHEIGHSFLKGTVLDGKKDPIHALIYDFGEKRVCIEK